VLFEKLIGSMRDHVDERVPNSDHIETGTGSHKASIEVDGHERARYLGRHTRSPTYQRLVGVLAPTRSPAQIGRTPCLMAGTIRSVTDLETLDPYRLPRHTAPSRYELTLWPDLGEATFAGTVVIDLHTSLETPELVLNADELDIESCQIDGVEASFRLDAETERMFIAPELGVATGDHRLTIVFRGVLNDKLRGWYRSTYRDDAGVDRVIATTQMQSTDCRRAFPCWDEPDFKAVFSVTLVIDDGLLAVSNCREISSELDQDGKRTVRFADTMIMSAYLVAFIVGPLEATEWVDVDGIPVRVVHVPGKGELTEFGLDVAAFCLRWYQKYYGIPYPSDKVDLLALPDFAAGAMENLGCITFRENLLLVDSTTATQNERELVADVVAHELAHMWFGDLVTMRWWNGIWLNEAFATFMEIAACDAYRPDWERWTSFGLERSVAFETDSLQSTRPVEFEVHSPADCEGMFDVLTYQKGGALLRMLEQYLGEDRFRAGVGHYLSRHAYSNTETQDLWDAIEHTSGEPVRRIMDTWIWQPGFPLISAATTSNELVLTQRRFSFDPDAVSDALWAVPLAVRIGDHTETFLFDTDEIRLPLGDQPVVVNAGGHGFVRVSYSEELRGRLTRDVVASMNTLERYNLVDDAWNAVTAGALEATSYLELIGRFADEREYGVWQSIAIGLRSIRRFIGDDDIAAAGFSQTVRDLAGPALADLGDPADGESDLTSKLRGVLLTLVAVHGADEAARTRARDLYAQWSDDPSSVDSELVAASTSIIAATGNTAEYESMLDRSSSGSTPQEQLRHLHLLAEFPDEGLMIRTCELAMSDEVRSQNAPFLLRGCIGNQANGSVAWRFVRRNWNAINDRFPRNTIVRLIETVKVLDQPDQVADVQGFFAEHPIPQGAKTLEQILERQRVNAATRSRSSESLRAAFTN
jgi:puromycin-sensitive aminopeptidase